MKIVCPRGHPLAEVSPGRNGAVLTLHCVVLGDLDHGSKHGITNRPGEAREQLLSDDPVYRNDAATVACRRCGTDHRIMPLTVKGMLDEGKKRLVIRPRRAHRP